VTVKDPDLDDEYQPVAISDYWGLISLLFFLAAMTTRFLVRLLPPGMRGYGTLPPLAAKAVPLLALVGILASLAGLRRKRQDVVARLGLLFNLVVFILGSLFLLAFWIIRMR
jgi:hypothetical protein